MRVNEGNIDNSTSNKEVLFGSVNKKTIFLITVFLAKLAGDEVKPIVSMSYPVLPCIFEAGAPAVVVSGVAAEVAVCGRGGGRGVLRGEGSLVMLLPKPGGLPGKVDSTA